MGNIIEGLADHVTDKKTELGTAQSGAGTLSYAASGMKGWRNTMEDCHTLCNAIPVDGSKGETLKDHSLFAVYDGHGGNLSSTYAGERFIAIFSERSEWKKYAELPKEGNKSRADVTGVDLIRSALKGTFLGLDNELRNIQTERNDYIVRNPATESRQDGETRQRLERSGSTCCVVVITPTHIICANAGDSRAILRRGGRVLPLSFDHKPSNIPEQERIVACGGYVRAKRVDGDLAVSRGLGDFSLKNQTDLPASKQKVIAEPDVIVYPRNEEKDEFILLACDGVWDVASNEQCATMIQEVLDEGETEMGLVCEELLDMCLERNSRDNMTVTLIGFPRMQMCRSSLTARNAVWNRRAARRARLLEAQARLMAEKAAKGVGIQIGTSAVDTAQKTNVTKPSVQPQPVPATA